LEFKPDGLSSASSGRRTWPKEKVLALKLVVEDVGADRGILVSQVGFQPGAVRAAEHTNVTLTGLDELKERAREDIMFTAVRAFETETIKLENSLHKLFVSEKTGPFSFTSKPRPGVNGREVFDAMGRLGRLKSGFERARIPNPPFLVEIDELGKCEFAAMTIDELVGRATAIIRGAQATLERNSPR
jgi:hypothetical protein